MKVFIDADACPVVNETVALCKEFNKECIIICDTSHAIERDGAMTIVVEKGADSADFRLVNMLGKGDLAITQDYALAAMSLSKGARIINQNGMEYTDKNIDSLLMSRFIAKKVRNAGGRLKGPSKRTKEQTESFIRKLSEILEEEK
ncbi:MAG: DUF188 domain-containing protein [Clostridia bacterium]|nr:DUF188 domain-containing protein [Clostridia bacterium]